MKQYAGEKKPSMKRRAEGHDYSARRIYMITMEVQDRRPLLGTLYGNPFVTDGDPDAPGIRLSPLGEAVAREWQGIPRYYPQIDVLALQIMPDHLHGILFVREALPVHLSQVITGFKVGCNRHLRELQCSPMVVPDAATNPQPTEKILPCAPSSPSSPSASSSLSSPSVSSSLSSPHAAAESPQSPFRPLFLPGYNDLILRSFDELPVWRADLRDNPRRLLMKRARPEWLRPFFNFRYGSQVYSGIGNLALLQAPSRLAVRVSRRLSHEEAADDEARYLAKARAGTVLISPAISTGEKRVMRAAFDAKLPTIVIMENGFTPLSKPHGEQFYACAEGRLLMLSPWEHHNEQRKLTRQQCSDMNVMALELSGQLSSQ